MPLLSHICIFVEALIYKWLNLYAQMANCTGAPNGSSRVLYVGLPGAIDYLGLLSEFKTECQRPEIVREGRRSHRMSA